MIDWEALYPIYVEYSQTAQEYTWTNEIADVEMHLIKASDEYKEAFRTDHKVVREHTVMVHAWTLLAQEGATEALELIKPIYQRKAIAAQPIYHKREKLVERIREQELKKREAKRRLDNVTHRFEQQCWGQNILTSAVAPYFISIGRDARY